MTIRGGGDPQQRHGFHAAFENGTRRPGASPPMRMAASWFRIPTDPPNTRLWRDETSAQLASSPRLVCSNAEKDDGNDNLVLDTKHPIQGLLRRSLALRPAHSRGHQFVARYTEGFSHFVTSMTAPVASGWSGCRVGLAPTGKRRLSRRTPEPDINSAFLTGRQAHDILRSIADCGMWSRLYVSVRHQTGKALWRLVQLVNHFATCYRLD